MSRLTDFRKQKDIFFARDPESPLTPEQKLAFKGLRYFPENPALCFELKAEEFSVKEEIRMQTTTGDAQVYRRFGKIRFIAAGQDAELTIYVNEQGYFLPFVDSQKGLETYPAGRYLEPDALSDGRFLVDFNYAYNPFCAYNERWSCPITPFENRLKVPIRAGEMIFPHPEESG